MRLLAALLIALVLLMALQAREHFASPEAIKMATQAKNLFEGGRTDYGSFRDNVRHDPVVHSDTRRLWMGRKLTPESMQVILDNS
jgi:hypothetical protein